MFDEPINDNAESADFQTTHWSMVLDAARARPTRLPDAAVNDALSQLCERYWYPLYSFARSKGESPPDAMDATQAFFADFLEKSWIDRADPQRGRFRSYLITVFRRFLNDQKKRAQAQKRGGNLNTISFDATTAEQRYQLEPAIDETAEDVFEKRWALTLLQQVHQRLRQESVSKGKEAEFEELQAFLTSSSVAPYAEVAERLDITEANVKVKVHRMKQRFRAILEEEVAHTVNSSAEIKSELQSLLAALSR